MGPFKPSVFAPIFKALGRRIERRHFTQPPIIIGGCARSGTTLLLGLLAAHPKIFAFPRELGFLTHWPGGTVGNEMEPTRLDRFYRELIRRRIPSSVHRWCEKSPANVRHIQEILGFYGNGVRFIHLIRDPRDVCISEHPKPGKKGRYHVEPARWIWDVKAGLEYEGHPSVLTLRFEDLLRHTEEKLNRICRFLGEEMVQELEDWSFHTNVKDNPAWEGGAEPLSTRSIGKWKNADPERIREILQYPFLKEIMEQCGYSPGE